MALFAKHRDWQMAFQDEVWWSRLAQPRLHSWTTDTPLALVQKAAVKTDPEPKALCCYGALLVNTEQEQGQGQMLLRFVDGRPVSQVTCDFLDWLAQTQAQAGKKVLGLIWDNASWHISKMVKSWLKAHNRRVKEKGGCRVLVCFLPSKSPWLNAIEPKWVHGKRAIVEPVRTLTASQLTERICAYYRCEHELHLTQQLP
jgi:transposase